MGMEQIVSFGERRPPAWSAVAQLLHERGFGVQMRMIDGELAFPDEQPAETWRELRLGTPLGMVTVRRSGETVVLVTWGNADAGQRQAWHALTWAFAEVGGGQVQSAQGALSAAAFAAQAELPPALGQAESGR
jgi:hypothetical protein